MRDKTHADTDVGELELRNYDEVHEVRPPPPLPVDRHEHPQSRQSEGSYTSIPEEMGFHVSVNNDEQTFKESNDYEDVDNSRMTDEAMGYLSGATYRPNYTEMDYDQRKLDLEQSSGQNTTEFNHDSPLYGNAPMLETAIQYKQMEELDGDIIDQIDYQNVTIVQTSVGNTAEAEAIRELHTGGIHLHSPGASEDDVDYLSVESFDMKDTSKSDVVSGNQPNVSQAAVHPDAVSLNSGTLLYENFDPHQYLPGADEHAATFETNRYRSGVDEYVYQHNGIQPQYQDTLNLAVPEEAMEEDLYINVEASRLQAQILADKDMHFNPTISADEDELNYENTTPEMFQRMH